ncbi:MAG: thermostable hemolysin [Porticoccaceae bacterium]|jgi:hypothetical protein|nr:thermostable hemolysin [Porticoccaceae bacterium]MEA3300813.1 thermostable hemolysin [Pseudomonadota bacterium]HLS99240.1 thermostable hemolysin [Porticoccaceae bacterium]
MPSTFTTAVDDDARREAAVINRSLGKLLTPTPELSLLRGQDPGRAAVEAFIAERFHHHHGARISEFLPALLALRCRGELCAALGLRPAALGNLFLEHYLDTPAEQAIAALTRSPVSRTGIVEVGNLVSGRGGASALLFLMLLAVVHRAGFHWVMFTGTPEVLRGIGKLGFTIRVLCPARPEALPGDRDQWGSYYDESPQVAVGFIAESMAACHQSRLMSAALALFDGEIGELAATLRALA